MRLATRQYLADIMYARVVFMRFLIYMDFFRILFWMVLQIVGNCQKKKRHGKSGDLRHLNELS